MYLQAINKVKVTYQGQGHTGQGQGQIKVNIKLRSFLRRDTPTRVVLHLNQMRSCLK